MSFWKSGVCLPTTGIRFDCLRLPSPPTLHRRSLPAALANAPRDNTFAVASVGPVPGFFCSGWTLAVSAKEMGRLTQLKSKLKRLVEEKTAGAELLLMFAEVADSGGSPDETQALLSKMVESDPLDDLTLNGIRSGRTSGCGFLATTTCVPRGSGAPSPRRENQPWKRHTITTVLANGRGNRGAKTPWDIRASLTF